MDVLEPPVAASRRPLMQASYLPGQRGKVTWGDQISGPEVPTSPSMEH